jgi:hypothetical protein
MAWSSRSLMWAPARPWWWPCAPNSDPPELVLPIQLPEDVETASYLCAGAWMLKPGAPWPYRLCS